MAGRVLYPGERPMMDNDYLFHGMFYLIQGRVTRLDTSGRCSVVKRELGVEDIRWCNLKRRRKRW